MNKAVKIGDIGTEHDGFHTTNVMSGSPSVMADGKPMARLGDKLAPHSKPGSGSHPRVIAAGSSRVFIDGKPAVRTGDAISCGGIVIGSGTVNIG